MLRARSMQHSYSAARREYAGYLQIAAEVCILAFLPPEALRAAPAVLAMHDILGEEMGHNLGRDNVANVVTRCQLGKGNAADFALLQTCEGRASTAADRHSSIVI